MNDSRFEQLVNLYLDKEISPEEFGVLRQELAQSEQRRTAFKDARRLRAAERNIFRAIYQPDPDDGILPEPTRQQKLVAYLTQAGSVAAAIAISVSLYLYATQGDAHAFNTPAAEPAVACDELRANQRAALELANTREIVFQVVEFRQVGVQGNARVANQLQIRIMTPSKLLPCQDDPLQAAIPGIPVHVGGDDINKHLYEAMQEIPGMRASFSLQRNAPHDYQLVVTPALP
ncbi:MAG: hypothetical protein AAGA45_08080 [Verrucomicrobiota bacterium]